MRLLFTLFISFITIVCFAQGDTTGKAICKSPFTCSANLANELYTSSQLKETDESYAKTPFPANSTYDDVLYKGGVDDPCKPVTHSIDCNRTNPGSLTYHVVYPDLDYSTCKLPVIILFHGGGFIDCSGNNTSSDVLDLCRDFAKRGFIAISVEYRLGIKQTDDPFYTAQQMLGIWRGGQDARGAVKTVVYREIQNIETLFHIDVNNIFIGGNSAGSLIAMNVAYYKPAMLNVAFPGAGGIGISNSNVLGSINQDYYFAPVATTYQIKGVLNMWGSVLLPNGVDINHPETYFFAGSNILPPTISFCGEQDLTFNYANQPLYFLPAMPATNQPFRSENYCLNDPSGSTAYTIINQSPNNGYILGSQDIYYMLKSQVVLTEFYLDSDMGHGLSKPPYSASNPFISNFGTSAMNISQINVYIASRAATFFQRIVSNSSLVLTTTMFVDCENTRVTCNMPSPATCPADIP